MRWVGPWRRRRVRQKEEAELRFWRGRYEAENGALGHHGKELYCDHFGVETDFYAGKRVLDVGCGPRGTLEWADMAAERVGLDPLVPRYRDLGIDRHAMRYVAAGAEQMPFDADSFDIVTTMNSLDHVDDVDAAVAELGRVAAPGATWFLLVEAGAPPTATEPQTIDWEFLDSLDGWHAEWSRRIALGADHDVYGSLARGSEWEGGAGLLMARLTRSPGS